MLRLDSLQRRVLGVLVEKLLSTPQYYPLTVNSLAAGCNQKSNRNPQMEVSEDTVRRCLEGLRSDGLVSAFWPEGARVEKWRSRLQEVLSLESERALAVLAELLLRGPQSIPELRTRASRMRHELSHEEVEAIIAQFRSRPEPLVVELPRESGQRQTRFAHTLYPEGEEPQPERAPTAGPAGPPVRVEPAGGVSPRSDLEARLERLEARVDELEAQLRLLTG